MHQLDPSQTVGSAPRRTALIPRRAAMAALTTVAVLVLLFRFDPGMHAEAQLASGSGTGTGSVAAASPAPSTSSADTTTGTTSDATASTIVTGDAVATRFGTVQVEVTVANGQLVDVAALELPSGGRDSQISAYAEPILRSEALRAGTANIDTVSGATYTSMGYIQSLQSALDKAGFG